MTSPSPAEAPVPVEAPVHVESSDVEAALYRLRQIGWALLAVALVIDLVEVPYRRVRAHFKALPTQLNDKVEPRSSTIAAIAQSVLDASSGRR